jgi:hypothetical protein
LTNMRRPAVGPDELADDFPLADGLARSCAGADAMMETMASGAAKNRIEALGFRRTLSTRFTRIDTLKKGRIPRLRRNDQLHGSKQELQR